VSYLHAGGIDRPLAIKKDGLETVVPHENWRGMFAWGTWGSGSQVGQRSDCMTSLQTNCLVLHWPGYRTSAYHADGNPGDQEYWLGSLVEGQRDASGQIYMRNRYYNPASGQFTQTDPIGLAGGLNVYGFAAGDPVSYSDPYGLCPGCGSGFRTVSDIVYSSPDKAAEAAMTQMHVLSVQRDLKSSPTRMLGLEYGTEIVGADGVYMLNEIRAGSENGFSPNTNVEDFAGDVHSHGARSFGVYNDESFSTGRGGDIEGIKQTKQPGYLVTPSGRMLKYDPNVDRNPSGAVEEMGRVPARAKNP
jgi:RHS repeat-associated protein